MERQSLAFSDKLYLSSLFFLCIAVFVFYFLMRLFDIFFSLPPPLEQNIFISDTLLPCFPRGTIRTAARSVVLALGNWRSSTKQM